jgi:ElaB/YqjD/DUF883 family membrane-anchored ribosome-binding protein
LSGAVASPPQSLDNGNTSASQLFLGNTALKSFTEPSYLKQRCQSNGVASFHKEGNSPMSPSPQSPDAQELAGQIDAIRADIQSLTSTVSRIANKQVNRAQDKAMETANQAEEAIKQNPLTAVAIAVGLGFLFGVFTRR